MDKGIQQVVSSLFFIPGESFTSFVDPEACLASSEKQQ